MHFHIHNSNLIEKVDSQQEDMQSLVAWDYLKSQQPLTIDHVLNTHGLITKNLLNKEKSGHFRGVNVYVGTHKFPPSFLLQSLVQDWLDALNDETPKYTPKEFHIWFEQIHPFVDGNGRTGRMLMWWDELRRNQSPTLIRHRSTNSADGVPQYEYYDWFAEKKFV